MLDSGGGQHSLFAKHFIQVLRSNDRILNGHELHSLIYPQVKQDAQRLRAEQFPQYAPIKFSGHGAGDFIFVPQSL